MEENGQEREMEVLLVEDNPADAALTYLALEKNQNIVKSKIHLAKDGFEALEYLFGDIDADDYCLSHHPKLILLDLKLPKEDGLSVLEKIKEHPAAKEIPVFILTGSKEKTDWIDSYSLGVEYFLHKSIDFNKFIETLGWVLRETIEKDKLRDLQQ